jgi:ribosomal protein L19
MNQALLEKIESEQFRKDKAEFGVGDSVRVHTKVVEGDKERIQIFSGVVIGKRGRGLNETFTVRRISYGEAWSVFFRCTRRAWTRSKSSAKARSAARSSPTCASASAKVRRW